MTKVTWKQFIADVGRNSVQFLGAISNDKDIIGIIDDKLSGVPENYDRKMIPRSKHIEWIFKDGSTSRLDKAGTITFYKGVYMVKSWNTTTYRIEK